MPASNYLDGELEPMLEGNALVAGPA